ncbi:MAG: hypothetical protein V2A58_09010 [Planctomycetota bacterium]
MSKLEARLEKVCREAVDPAKWSKKTNPITREELGADFRAVVQLNADPRKPRAVALYFDHAKLGDAVKPHAEIISVGSRIADMGDGDVKNEVVPRSVGEFVGRGIPVFSIWGFVPYHRDAAKSDLPEPAVPPATHRWLLENTRGLFLGYEVGEQDGRFLGNFAKRARRRRRGESDYDYYTEQFQAFAEREANFEKHLLAHTFGTRRAAYREFRRWVKPFEEGMHGHLIPIGHTNYAHYHCELEGTRIVGMELALILLNHQVAFAFLRGASRQYGLLTWALPSIWSQWGFSYPAKPGQTHTGTTEIGPEKGTPTHLARRMWYLAYMYGVSLFGIEAGYFSEPEGDYVDGKVDEPPGLSALGKLQVEGWRWCREHPGRGAQYNPVALVLDFHNGWLAPKHGYQYLGEKRLAWNALPYEKSDHQIDNFFRWVFPGYEEGAYHRDGTGTFVPTPFGDVFDVLLSNADAKVLKRYGAIVLLGGCAASGTLKRKLVECVRRGADLVLACENIADDDPDFYGVSVGKTCRKDLATATEHKTFEEEWFTYRELEPRGAEVLLSSGKGDPIVTVNPFGRGRVVVIAVEHWMSDMRGELEKKTGLASQKVADHSRGRKFRDRTDFFEERNWNGPYNSRIKKMIIEGRTLGEIEDEVCVHCRVECTNQVPTMCDILVGVKEVLGSYLASFTPVVIQGPPVHYAMNLTEEQDKLILTLANHGEAEWRGAVRFKNPALRVSQVREWMRDEPARLEDVRIGGRDLKVLEITLDRGQKVFGGS